ncbi:MAG TPA: hypothetical protein VGF94_24700 [Kofleriaceae bacterium]|jgi:hypothetical protein
MTVREARARYFAMNGFSDATYRDRWVKFKVGPVPVAFPNTPSRQRAIPMHDLHHVATGYATTFAGEAEIGAWEVAGGCGDYAAAWVLNAIAFAGGMVVAPRRTYRAFVRGRHARTLYHAGWHDDLLELEVAELRRRVAFADAAPRATWRDRAAFAGWLAVLAMPGATLVVAALVLRTR